MRPTCSLKFRDRTKNSCLPKDPYHLQKKASRKRIEEVYRNKSNNINWLRKEKKNQRPRLNLFFELSWSFSGKIEARQKKKKKEALSNATAVIQISQKQRSFYSNRTERFFFCFFFFSGIKVVNWRDTEPALTEISED